ncbi:RidA family protein [Actinophytocola sp.]|uniref:RidA family protein n=1 Tax=Actinophytocola sp. TaxID=1872138 RepID=UPI003D6B6A38
MTLDKFNADTMAAPKVPLSHGVVAGGWLHVSGMVARAPGGEIVDGDIVAATRQCLENMEAVLATREVDRTSVVKLNVYLTDFGDYAGMNQAFEEFFDSPYPARTTIQAGALGIGQVELDAVAYLGE